MSMQNSDQGAYIRRIVDTEINLVSFSLAQPVIMQTIVNKKNEIIMTNLLLSSRLKAVNERIIASAGASGRPIHEVRLLAVSKTKPLEQLEQAYQAGQRHFAENYAQEAVEKRTSWPHSGCEWHFIGPLQSNKTRAIAEHYDWVHTVDRFKIAKRLNDQRPSKRAPLKVLIQVNISNDPAKSGVLTEEVYALAKQLLTLPALEFKGLMTITAANLSKDDLKAQFLQLKSLRDTLIQDFSSCTELSMGMSADFELAIECGATMVRVGSEIFGARPTTTE
ncbi:YggS family pyridoxal phosphate-dependent enzyme [Reinekea marina]|uniref:Pyridoxal phosphate homeostasis protein n=3 Tax=Reinekea marina TaxID=1310421 RepID=A0ABV7WR86_9GAMM